MPSHLKACPKCGKLCKGAGLNGHLRFAHRLDEKQVASLAISAKSAGPAPSKPTRPDNPLYRLIDELMEIQRRKAELAPLTSPLLYGGNETAEKAMDLLERMEKEISKKIDEMKRKKGLPVGFMEELEAAGDWMWGIKKKGDST